MLRTQYSQRHVGDPTMNDENTNSVQGRKRNVGFKTSFFNNGSNSNISTAKTPAQQQSRRKALGDISNATSAHSKLGPSNQKRATPRQSSQRQLVKQSSKQKLKQLHPHQQKHPQQLKVHQHQQHQGARTQRRPTGARPRQPPRQQDVGVGVWKRHTPHGISTKRNAWTAPIPRASINYRDSVSLSRATNLIKTPGTSRSSSTSSMDDVEWPAGRVGGDDLSDGDTILSFELDLDPLEIMDREKKARERAMFLDARDEAELQRSIEAVFAQDTQDFNLPSTIEVKSPIDPDEECPWDEPPPSPERTDLSLDLDSIII